MTITSIKKQQKNPDRVSVFVDGKYGFSLDLNQLLSLKIKSGLEIDGQKLKEYKKLSAEGKQKMTTLSWIMVRPRSEKEYYQYLRRKKIEDELARSWAEEFMARGYLNDESFAKWWAQSRRQNKYSSTKKIKLELMQKGISKDYIEQALEYLEDDEASALKQVIAKKSKLQRYKNDRDKFIKYLMGQGFRYQDIVNELDFPAGE